MSQHENSARTATDPAAELPATLRLGADCPREAWPALANAGWDGGPTPLDMDGLLEAVAGEELRRGAGAHDRPRAPARRRLGPRAGFLPRRTRLRCHDVLPRRGRVRLSGGYHHHLAFNVWRGEGVPSALPGRVGLSHWTV